MRIAICSIGEGLEYAIYTSNNLKNYCDLYGYDFIYSGILDKTKPPQWSKVLLIKQTMETDIYDWLMWIDADIAITNKNVRLENIIEQYSENKDFILCNEDDYYRIQPSFKIYPNFNVYNTGVFLIRCCQWSKEFLKKWNDQKPNLTLFEQDAFRNLYDNDVEIRQHTNIIPQRIMNSHPTTHLPGDFIIHYFGWYMDKTPLKYYL